jgi:glycosyltransferase involved in cell wall biosynthesis
MDVVYPDGDYEPGEREIPVRSIPNPFYPGYRIPLFKRTKSLPELDVVHCHGPAPVGLLGRYYAKKHDLPSVYTHHTPLEHYFEQNTHSPLLASMLERLYLPLENNFLKKFDAVTASTEEINRNVEPIELPVGVDTEFFSHRATSFIDEMNLEPPVAGYSGRLSLEKNVSELLDFAEYFDGTLVIVGDGPQKQNLKAHAPSNVVFLNWLEREKLPEFYSGIDVFVTASRGDTLNLTTLEANACGTPVVAADLEPFTHTIQQSNRARYEPGDVNDMVEKVSGVLRNNFETRAAVKSYSMAETVEKLERLYTHLQEEI